MTDRTTLTNREIKMMWSKCDLDGDGYLDFEEFKEMIMRSRERKELARLKEEAEMTVSDEELDTIQEVTETESTPDSEEDIEEEIDEEEEDNSCESVTEEIEESIEHEEVEI